MKEEYKGATVVFIWPVSLTPACPTTVVCVVSRKSHRPDNKNKTKKNHRDAFYLSSSASKEMEIEMLISHHEVLYVLQRLTLVNSPIIG